MILYSSNLIEQLEEFFDNLASLDSCVDLSKEIIDEQRQLLKLKVELEKKERELIKKRKIPEWGGVNFVDNKKTKDRRKRVSIKNGKAHFQSSKLSQTKLMITDLHGYQKILQNFGKPINFYTHTIIRKFINKIILILLRIITCTNSKNPQAALMNMLSRWKIQSVPPSNEDIHLGIYAPTFREHLSKNNIGSLTEDKL